MRITNVMISNTKLGNINRNQRRANTFLEQLSTGRRINTPSQNPLMATRHIRMENTLNQIGQHRRNVEHAQSWTEVTEQATRELTTVMHRLEDLLTRADALESLAERRSFAEEINSLLEQKQNIMNRNIGGRYIFSGLRTNHPPFLNADAPDKAVFDIVKQFNRENIERTWVMDRSVANANPTSPAQVPNPPATMANPNHVAGLPVGNAIPNRNHLPGVGVGVPIPGPNHNPNVPNTIANPALMEANPDFNPFAPVSDHNNPVRRIATTLAPGAPPTWNWGTEERVPNPAVMQPNPIAGATPAFTRIPGTEATLLNTPGTPHHDPNQPSNAMVNNPRWEVGGDIYARFQPGGDLEDFDMATLRGTDTIPNPHWEVGGDLHGTPTTTPNWHGSLDAAGDIANPNLGQMIPNPTRYPIAAAGVAPDQTPIYGPVTDPTAPGYDEWQDIINFTNPAHTAWGDARDDFADPDPFDPTNPAHAAWLLANPEPSATIINPALANGDPAIGISLNPNPEAMITNPAHNPNYPAGQLVNEGTWVPGTPAVNPDGTPNGTWTNSGRTVPTEYRTTQISRIRLPHNANAGLSIPGTDVFRIDIAPNSEIFLLGAPHEGQINFAALQTALGGGDATVVPPIPDLSDGIGGNGNPVVFHDGRNGDVFAFEADIFETALTDTTPPYNTTNQRSFNVTYNQVGFSTGDLNPLVYFNSRLADMTANPAADPMDDTTPAPFPWLQHNPAYIANVPGAEPWIVNPNFDPTTLADDDTTLFTMDNQDMPFEFGVFSRMPMNLLAANLFTGTMFADIRGFARDILEIETTGQVDAQNRFRNSLIEERFGLPFVDAADVVAGESRALPAVGEPLWPGGPLMEAGMTLAQANAERNAAISGAGQELDADSLVLANEFLAREAAMIETVTNDRFNNKIGRVDGYMNSITEQHTDIGTRMRRLDLIADRLEDDNVTFETLSANNIGVDIAETVMRLTTAEVSLMASLQAGMHQVMNMTLLNFL